MVISLALEELLTIITQNSCPPDGFADVRLLVWNDKRIIRIRAAGKRYDPIEVQDGSLDYMGVKMICGLAERTEYLSALGVNTLIFIYKKRTRLLVALWQHIYIVNAF